MYCCELVVRFLTYWYSSEHKWTLNNRWIKNFKLIIVIKRHKWVSTDMEPPSSARNTWKRESEKRDYPVTEKAWEWEKKCVKYVKKHLLSKGKSLCCFYWCCFYWCARKESPFPLAHISRSNIKNKWGPMNNTT